jgi:peptide deformylase
MYPNKILRVRTPRIKEVDKKLEKDIADLKEVLTSESRHAAGLAAVQIGLNRRFFGLLLGDKKQLKVFINPVVESTVGERVKPMMVFDDGKQEEFLEGCLSFPDLFGVVKRYLKIKVSWEELENGLLVKKSGILTGIDAIAFQHEGEHLDGVLFVDYIKREGGALYKWVGDKKIKWSVDKVIDVEQS